MLKSTCFHRLENTLLKIKPLSYFEEAINAPWPCILQRRNMQCGKYNLIDASVVPTCGVPTYVFMNAVISSASNSAEIRNTTINCHFEQETHFSYAQI